LNYENYEMRENGVPHSIGMYFCLHEFLIQFPEFYMELKNSRNQLRSAQIPFAFGGKFGKWLATTGQLCEQ